MDREVGDHPIDFRAIDGKPVHTLFTIVSPAVKAHLGLLSKLSFGLREGPFAQAVRRQGSREEILQQAERLEQAMAQLAAVPVQG